MYEKLPFDKPETITKLGTKLFTRIKNEDQQRVIREFLSEQSASADRSNPVRQSTGVGMCVSRGLRRPNNLYC